jgi:hypothetical protein
MWHNAPGGEFGRRMLQHDLLHPKSVHVSFLYRS